MHLLFDIFNEILLYFIVKTYLQTYDQSELLQAKLEILSKTNMIDYVIDIRRMLYPDEDTPEVSKIGELVNIWKSMAQFAFSSIIKVNKCICLFILIKLKLL